MLRDPNKLLIMERNRLVLESKSADYPIEMYLIHLWIDYTQPKP